MTLTQQNVASTTSQGSLFDMSELSKTETTLTKAEIVNRLHVDLGFSKLEARELTESFFEEVAKTLEGNEIVKLSGFGNFVLWRKRARIGRNPKTGVSTTISARRVVTFKPGKKLRNRVGRARLRQLSQ